MMKLAYWNEYRLSLGLNEEIADPRRSGIKVGLTGSMKSYKQQVKDYLDKLDGDLKMILTLANADEVMAEYRVSLNVTDAVRIVAERQKRIQEEKARREAEAAAREARAQQEAKVEEVLEMPVAEEAPAEEVAEEPKEEIYSAKYLGYEIFGTMEQLKGLKAFLKDALKKYMDEKGIDYNE